MKKNVKREEKKEFFSFDSLRSELSRIKMNTSAEQFYNGELGSTFACFPSMATKVDEKGGRKPVAALCGKGNIHSSTSDDNLRLNVDFSAISLRHGIDPNTAVRFGQSSVEAVLKS